MKKISYLLIISLLALWLGTTSPIKKESEFIIVFLSYPQSLLILAGFFVSIYWLLKNKDFQLTRNEIVLGAALSSLGTIWICSMEPFGFKIFVDELALAGTAQMMHLDRLASVPHLAKYLSDGSFFPYNAILDKRPFLYPTLVSILHDLTGYRPSNSFVVNVILTWSICFTLILWTFRWGGKMASLLTLILLCGLPILTQNATSGSSEVVNIYFMVTTVVLAVLYLEKTNARTLTALAFSLVAWTACRYESIVFVFPFGALILYGWYKEKEIILPWPIYFIPLLFVIPLLHHNFTLNLPSYYWQDGPLPNRQATFSTSYIPENLFSAWNYFFSLTSEFANSFILSILGLSGFFFCAFAILLKEKLNVSKTTIRIIIITFCVAVPHFIVMMNFNFGLFDWIMTTRLSLPLQIAMIMAAVLSFTVAPRAFLALSIFMGTVVLYIQTLSFNFDDWIERGMFAFLLLILAFAVLIFNRFKNSYARRAIFCYILVFTFLVNRPIMAKHKYLEQYVSYLRNKSYFEFINSFDQNDILFVTDSTIVPVISKKQATYPDLFFNHLDEVIAQMKQEDFHEIYVFDCIIQTREKTHYTRINKIKIPETVKTEIVANETFAPGFISHIHRVMAIELPDGQSWHHPDYKE